MNYYNSPDNNIGNNYEILLYKIIPEGQIIMKLTLNDLRDAVRCK